MSIRRLVQSAWMTGVAFFAVAVLTSSAMAATVIANCTGIGPSNTELNASVGCPQFNGTGLLSVEIAFTGYLNG